VKKVLGIVGSLRDSGNCEVMIKQISREIKEPHELRLLRLPELDLKYCRGCYRCLQTPYTCVIRDDLEIALDAISESDGLILAAPTYFLAAHACLKVFVDRGISFYGRHEKLWGKPAVGLGVAGLQGKEGGVVLDIQRFFISLMADLKSSGVVYGALPGEAYSNVSNLDVAKKQAEALFSESTTKSKMSCRYCGSNAFSFLSENKVQCLLCGEYGLIKADNDHSSIEMYKSSHPLFSSEHDALLHREWLNGMVKHFDKNKKSLAKVRKEFRDSVEWVRPRAAS
jgi:multimeric flavodoxin WrbA